MPTYALLGATGSTGSAILHCLLEQPPKDLTLNIFVRNKAKLVKAFPGLENTAAFAVKVIEGSPNNTTALQESLKGASVIFMCIATNESKRGTSVAYDTTTAIIDALILLQKEQDASAYTKPAILFLRSTSLNETFAGHYSWLQYYVIWFCLNYVYSDLDRAAKLLPESPELLEYVYVDPPAIHDPDGTMRTGHELYTTGAGTPGLNYADLGAAFCEIAERRDEFVGQGVGVAATGHVRETWAVNIGYLSRGAKARVFG